MLTCPAPTAINRAAFSYTPCSTGSTNGLGCLVDNVLEATNPSIVGFGEIHYGETLEQFGADVLPLLPQYGIRDLVLEHLVSSPEIERELLAHFNYQTEINAEETPELYEAVNTPEYKGLAQLLHNSRILGIQIHPGGPTEQELDDPAIQAEINSNGLWPKTIRLFGQGLERSLLQVVRSGRKVAIYGGLRHNDLDGTARQGSFSPRLTQICGRRYVEIDLVSRRRLIDILHPLTPSQGDYTRKLSYYEHNASAATNVFLNPRPGQYAIILK